jgi:glycosyltransferase involved in cell wall biosynthesis
MKEIKIVFLHNDFKVYWRGRLFYLKKNFTNYGISMNVIEIFGQVSAYSFDKANREEDWWECLFPEEELRELNVRYVREKIHKRLNEINPDYLVAGGVAFTSGAIGLQWAKYNKKKILIFDDTKHSKSTRNNINKFIKQTLTKQADAFLVPSHDYDEEYINWGVNKIDLYYGLNCVNNNFYSKRMRNASEFKNIFVCIARLVPIKNIDGLLLAWQNIEMMCPKYRLLIIGDGPQYLSLKNMIERLNLSSVTLLGALNSRNIAKILSESEALILPSFSEGWGMVVNEAMASGIPVISSTRVNASSTLLIEGANGYYFNPYSIDEITNAIIKYINTSQDKKLEMSRNARISVNKYGYKFLATEIFRAISDLNIKPYKEPNLLISKLINYWNGKFITAAWDSLK